jgi:hypothetical protein
VVFCRVNDARKKEETQKTGDLFRLAVNKFREIETRKVAITPLGELIPAND